MMLKGEKIKRDIAAVAESHGTTVPDLMGRSMYRMHVQARQAAYWLIWWKYGLSLTHVGRIFGRDHSTVLVGIGRHMERADIPHPWMRAYAKRRIYLVTKYWLAHGRGVSQPTPMREAA